MKALVVVSIVIGVFGLLIALFIFFEWLKERRYKLAPENEKILLDNISELKEKIQHLEPGDRILVGYNFCALHAWHGEAYSYPIYNYPDTPINRELYRLRKEKIQTQNELRSLRKIRRKNKKHKN